MRRFCFERLLRFFEQQKTVQKVWLKNNILLFENAVTQRQEPL